MIEYDEMRRRHEAALKHWDRCELCEWRCRAARSRGERGMCGAGTEARVWRHGVEYGEEISLVPSHVIYISACNLRCTWCIAADDGGLDPARGEILNASWLARVADLIRDSSATNIQWSGGEPGIFVPAILGALSGVPIDRPIVWKTNLYATPQAMDLVDGIVDVYLADFKFGNDDCARRLCGASCYMEILTRNLRLAADRGRLIVRHLLLPGHEQCCWQPIARWLAANLPHVELSVRGGYLPTSQAVHSEDLAKPLARGIEQQARRQAVALGLKVIA